MLERIFQLKAFRAMRSALAALAILVLTVNGTIGHGPIAAEALIELGPSRSLWAAAYARSALATDVLRRHRSRLPGKAAGLRPMAPSGPPSGERPAMAPARRGGLVASLEARRTAPIPLAKPAGFTQPAGAAGAVAPGPLGSRAPPFIA